MHVTRMLLSAEALLLGSTGVLCVAIPEAFLRTLGPTAAAESMVVPALGAAMVGAAALQHGLIGLRDSLPLRLLLQCRLVTDVLLAAAMLLHSQTFLGASDTVLLYTLSVALLFAAVRFYAFVMLSEGLPVAPPVGARHVMET